MYESGTMTAEGRQPARACQCDRLKLRMWGIVSPPPARLDASEREPEETGKRTVETPGLYQQEDRPPDEKTLRPARP